MPPTTEERPQDLQPVHRLLFALAGDADHGPLQALTAEELLGPDPQALPPPPIFWQSGGSEPSEPLAISHRSSLAISPVDMPRFRQNTTSYEPWSLVWVTTR